MKRPTLTEHLLKEVSGDGFAIGTGRRQQHAPQFTGENREAWQHWITVWAPNAAKNYATVSRASGIDILVGAARGIPAIIAGIGPSLEADLEWIGKATENTIIIATDASLRVLQANGIDPHLVVAFDCRAQNVTMLEGVKTDHLVMVANSCLDPGMIKAWAGKTVFFNMGQAGSDFTEQVLPCLFPHVGILSNAGTVGNMCVHLAHAMGCGPIILAGMDLCYQPVQATPTGLEPAKDGAPRVPQAYRYRCQDYAWRAPDPAGGLPEGSWEPTENKVLYDNDIRVSRSFEESIHGLPYRVDPELKFYRNILVDLVGQADLEAINTAERGALSSLFPTMPIKTALVEFCQKERTRGQSVVPHLWAILAAQEGGQP